jgi:hypothetical protein
MVFSNCRELVRPVDAKKWFAITPVSVASAKSGMGETQQNYCAAESCGGVTAGNANHRWAWRKSSGC